MTSAYGFSGTHCCPRCECSWDYSGITNDAGGTYDDESMGDCPDCGWDMSVKYEEEPNVFEEMFADMAKAPTMARRIEQQCREAEKMNGKVTV